LDLKKTTSKRLYKTSTTSRPQTLLLKLDKPKQNPELPHNFLARMAESELRQQPKKQHPLKNNRPLACSTTSAASSRANPNNDEGN
jgi:hypothetical protein